MLIGLMKGGNKIFRVVVRNELQGICNTVDHIVLTNDGHGFSDLRSCGGRLELSDSDLKITNSSIDLTPKCVD